MHRRSARPHRPHVHRSFILLITRAIHVACIGLLLAASPGCDSSGSNDLPDGADPGAMAEDLWGARVDLARYADRTLLIQPFSPANCGYCLFDGEFIEQNYFTPNAESGGVNFYQCLFNPQLDVYTFTKHYRTRHHRGDRGAATPVLTYPLALHQYHRNGFPWLIGFRQGELVYRGALHPYAPTFTQLREILWPGTTRDVTLTSPLHLANDFVFDNRHEHAIYVVADDDSVGHEQMAGWVASLPRPSGRVVYERDLTPADLQRHVYFRGKANAFRFDALTGGSSPIRFDSTSIQIDAYRFPRDSVRVRACFPSPHHSARFVVLNLVAPDDTPAPNRAWVDYAIHAARPPADGAADTPLLEGRFRQHAGNRWEFDASLSVVGAGVARFCAGGVCPAPVAPTFLAAHDLAVRLDAPETRDGVTTYRLGNSACRFPALAVDPVGICWVSWEEEGDILLASLNRDGSQSKVVVENDDSDSYRPLLHADGSDLWVLYLNDRSGHHRFVARLFDGERLSGEILLSVPGLFDVITPAVTGDGAGKLVLYWTEWKANQRYPRYRRIERRVLGEVQDVAIKRSGIVHVNAWHPALDMRADGEVWGAWNQHYPASLGVCAGNLREEAGSVTRLTDAEYGDINENENGGYPDLVFDATGRAWVFWETSGWDLLRGGNQSILGSSHDAEQGQWSLPYTLSREDETYLNQSPTATVDDQGTIWVAWSGRVAAENRIEATSEPWRIYRSHLTGDRWATPVCLSPPGENARAPQIITGRRGEQWIAWHAGTGDGMRIVVERRLPIRDTI